MHLIMIDHDMVLENIWARLYQNIGMSQLVCTFVNSTISVGRHKSTLKGLLLHEKWANGDASYNSWVHLVSVVIASQCNTYNGSPIGITPLLLFWRVASYIFVRYYPRMPLYISGIICRNLHIDAGNYTVCQLFYRTSQTCSFTFRSSLPQLDNAFSYDIAVKNCRKISFSGLHFSQLFFYLCIFVIICEVWFSVFVVHGHLLEFHAIFPVPYDRSDIKLALMVPTSARAHHGGSERRR